MGGLRDQYLLMRTVKACHSVRCEQPIAVGKRLAFSV